MGWRFTKRFLWQSSTVAIVILLPLALEATIEGEAQAQFLASQIGELGSNTQFRPY